MAERLPSVVNHYLSVINHEKKARTKIDHPQYRPHDCIQHSCFAAFQQ